VKDNNKNKKESAFRVKKKTVGKLHTINENNHIKNHFPEFTQDLWDTANIGIFILDANFKIAWINHIVFLGFTFSAMSAEFSSDLKIKQLDKGI